MNTIRFLNYAKFCHAKKEKKKKKEGWSFLCVLVVEQAVQVNMFILVEVGEEHLSVEVFSLLKKCRNKTQY